MTVIPPRSLSLFLFLSTYRHVLQGSDCDQAEMDVVNRDGGVCRDSGKDPSNKHFHWLGISSCMVPRIEKLLTQPHTLVEAH